MNNDGKDDLIIGAIGWNSGTGRAFVVYGSFFREYFSTGFFFLPILTTKTTGSYCKALNSSGYCMECLPGFGLYKSTGTCRDCSISNSFSNGSVPCICELVFPHLFNKLNSSNKKTQHVNKEIAQVVCPLEFVFIVSMHLNQVEMDWNAKNVFQENNTTFQVV